MAEPKWNNLSGTDGSTVFRELPEGRKVKLASGAVAEITGNPGDGAYLLVKILEHPEDPSQVGREETVFFMDIRGVENG